MPTDLGPFRLITEYSLEPPGPRYWRVEYTFVKPDAYYSAVEREIKFFEIDQSDPKYRPHSMNNGGWEAFIEGQYADRPNIDNVTYTFEKDRPMVDVNGNPVEQNYFYLFGIRSPHPNGQYRMTGHTYTASIPEWSGGEGITVQAHHTFETNSDEDLANLQDWVDQWWMGVTMNLEAGGMTDPRITATYEITDESSL